MFSFKSIVIIAGALAVADSSGVPVPFAAALVAPAQVGYAHAVPQNIPPYASQFSYVNRGLSPLAAPFAAPLTAPVGPAPYYASLAGGPSPIVAGQAPFIAGPAPYAAGANAAGPYVAGPAPYTLPGPAPFAGPTPFGAPQWLRSNYGFAPAFVR